MLNWIARRALERFGKRYDYDTAYMQAMLREAPEAFFKFAKIMDVAAHRRATPVDAYYAAKLTATLAEDCGPCAQLVANMAREAGAAEAQIVALLERDEAAMSRDAAVGFRFADAALRRTDAEQDVREEVRSAWGETGVIELSLAISVSRVFPMLKFGMGYGRECRRVRVGERDVAVAHAA